jgi:hypothetical protein
VHAAPVDPRDCVWEDDQPVYRVYFRHQPGVPAGRTDPAAMCACRELRVTDAVDVLEVLAWAERESRGPETWVAYVETAARRDAVDGVGLLRIHGRDPNAEASRTAGGS